MTAEWPAFVQIGSVYFRHYPAIDADTEGANLRASQPMRRRKEQ